MKAGGYMHALDDIILAIEEGEGESMDDFRKSLQDKKKELKRLLT